MIRWLLIPLFLAACSASLDPALRRPDGAWHVQCGAALERCVKRAEDLCKGRGYLVISGMSKRKLYGAELGVSQVEERQAELDFACADKRGELPTLTAPSATPVTLPPNVYAPVVAPEPGVVAPAPSVVAPAPSAVAPAPVAPAPAPAH